MLNFTPSEKRAINITVLIILTAGIIQLFQLYSKKEKPYDYADSDSIFSRLTHQYKYSQKSLENGHYLSNGYNEINKSRILELKSININMAKSEELQKLPRIGPAIAKRIIEYRERTGRFKSIDELLNVKGIGKKTLENIKPYLKI